MSETTDARAEKGEKGEDGTSSDAKAGLQLGPTTTTDGGEPARLAYEDIDAATEKRVRRKLDRVLLPTVSLLYLVAFLDRSNIGNAHTAGMDADLGLSDANYQVDRGLASSLQAAAFNFGGMMACRWFLAMAEAGFAPGVPYFLSFFYRKHEIGFRCGIYVSMAPLATCFAGALAYWITSGHNLQIASWRVLFLVEGLPVLALAVAAYFILPDSPDTAWFLNAEEKEVARARSLLQSGKTGVERLGRLDGNHVWQALRSPQTWAFPLMFFSTNVPFSALPVFLPRVLNEMGYSAVRAQGLTAPPYFLAFLVCISTTYLADRTQQRGIIIIVLSIIGAIGYVILAVAKGVGARYAGVFIASVGMFPAIGNCLSWCLNNFGSDTQRGVGVVIFQTLAQTGPILGTRLFPAAQGPYYVPGMAICAAFMFLHALVAVVLRAWFARENRRLDREEGAPGAAVLAGDARAAPEQDDMVGYRYVL